MASLTFTEGEILFCWYDAEGEKDVDDRVIARKYEEALGQPDLVSWLGEQLTEVYYEQSAKESHIARYG